MKTGLHSGVKHGFYELGESGLQPEKSAPRSREFFLRIVYCIGLSIQLDKRSYCSVICLSPNLLMVAIMAKTGWFATFPARLARPVLQFLREMEVGKPIWIASQGADSDGEGGGRTLLTIN